jgi:hypothetical protein
MLSDLRPPIAVVNAGIPGLNGCSFPNVIGYVRDRLQPDVVVVLFKDDDLDDTDILSRSARFERSFWFRMLYITNIEPIGETVHLIRRQWFDTRERSQVLVDDFDAIAAATAPSRLVILSELAADLRPAFTAWLATHPGVATASSWDDPRFAQAEQIPQDGHWSEAGCREIAAIVTPVLREQLATLTPRH